MQFINLNNTLVNLDQVVTINLVGKIIRMNYGNDTRGEHTYETEDKAKIAFSSIKTQINKIQEKAK